MLFRLRKYSKYVISAVIVVFSLILNYSMAVETTDLMEQVFKPSMEYDYIQNLGGRTKSQVGKEILRGGTEITEGDSRSRVCLDPETDEILYIYEDGERQIITDETSCVVAGGVFQRDIIDTGYKAPWIVRIAKFLLRVTMILAITMIIFNAVKYLIEVLGGKDRKSASSKKNLVSIAIGIIIALMSVTIINILVSVPKSSLGTSNDYMSIVTHNLNT